MFKARPFNEKLVCLGETRTNNRSTKHIELLHGIEFGFGTVAIILFLISRYSKSFIIIKILTTLIFQDMHYMMYRTKWSKTQNKKPNDAK